MGDENKQFEASQQKLQKARKEGQVVKSKDFSTALALLVMFVIILKLSPFIWDQISILFVYLYDKIPDKHIENIGYTHPKVIECTMKRPNLTQIMLSNLLEISQI